MNYTCKFSNREIEVLEALRELKQATSWDILKHLGKTNPNYVRPRLSDLQSKTMIDLETGKKFPMPLVKKLYQVKVGEKKEWIWTTIS